MDIHTEDFVEKIKLELALRGYVIWSGGRDSKYNAFVANAFARIQVNGYLVDQKNPKELLQEAKFKYYDTGATEEDAVKSVCIQWNNRNNVNQSD